MDCYLGELLKCVSTFARVLLLKQLSTDGALTCTPGTSSDRGNGRDLWKER